MTKSTIAPPPKPSSAQIEKVHLIVSRLEKNPLVKIEEIEHHLDLLAVFRNVHHAFQDGDDVVNPSSSSTTMRSGQTVFLARAQYRFDAWIEKVLQRADRDLNSPLSAEEIPPVDVLMFLHSYMLNPMNYYEDSIRVYPCLERIGPLLWKEAHALIDVTKCELTPTLAQRSLWERLTSMPFEAPLETTTAETVAITCPKCHAVSDFPWVNSSGTGVGQDFAIPCSNSGCLLTIDSDALCVAKFLKDASSSEYFARTILDHTGRQDLDSARGISQAIKNKLGMLNPIGWKMAKIQEAILLKDVDSNIFSQDGIKKILHAYHHPAQSSIDIKAAVMRQRRFIALMHDIHWSGENSSFVGKEMAFTEAIARYNQFFALSSELSIPALDIDIVFHTHQLSGQEYIKNCRSILGFVIDHDDSALNDNKCDHVGHSTYKWEDFYDTAYIIAIPPLFSQIEPNADSCKIGSYKWSSDHVVCSEGAWQIKL